MTNPAEKVDDLYSCCNYFGIKRGFGNLAAENVCSSAHDLNLTQAQAAMIRLLNCPGQSLFGLGNHDLQKNCPTGQVQIGSELTPTNCITQETSKIMA